MNRNLDNVNWVEVEFFDKQIQEPEPQLEKQTKVEQKRVDFSKYPPMLRSYLEMTERYPEYIILFQVGDFFEVFFESAKVVSEVLNIRLTSRNKDSDDQDVPLCGVPIHAIDNYLPKLVEAGYSCVVVTQSENDQYSNGVIKREISRIVTPGVRYESDGLDEKSYNYLACALINSRGSGTLAFMDVSTGHFKLEEIEVVEELLDNLQRVMPREIVLPSTLYGMKTSQESWLKAVKNVCKQINCVVVQKSFEKSNRKFLLERLDQYFTGDSLLSADWQKKIFALNEESWTAINAILSYVDEISFGRPPKISSLKIEDKKNFVFIDAATRRNLEILNTSIDGEKKNSLLKQIDYTITSMGARLFKDRILSPSRSVEEITYRYDITAELISNEILLTQLRENLTGIRDLDRLTTRITSGRIVPRDLGNLRDSLKILPIIFETLLQFNKSLLTQFLEKADQLEDIRKLLEKALLDELPIKLNDGEIFKDGFNKEVDRFREIKQNSKRYLSAIEERERQKTGINSLKIKYNNVFGYFIEITKSQLNKTPTSYERKQTLVNAERFITDELKELEQAILSADVKQIELEKQLFIELREAIAKKARRIQDVSDLVSQIDVFQSAAYLAKKNNYCRPQIIKEVALYIEQGRHPVVENLIGQHNFIPNAVTLDSQNRFAILTGPNMGGKSTFLKQIGLIQLLAQSGFFVPAKSVKLSLVDRIFTRIGAADDISSGDSTFMVEMREASTIVKKTTRNSLVLIDEIGRGTATTDGLALATAIAEWLNDQVQCRTIFATHFHELTALAEQKAGMFCLTVGIIEQGEEISFTHRIEKGFTDRSYGIEVAKIAGLPDGLLKRARQILEYRKGTELDTKPLNAVPELVFEESVEQNPQAAEVLARLQNINPENMKPIEALLELTKLKEMF
ncbi:MAG: DNA mismatch repair protein MutS [Deltaproteobacteria bacterium]|jgi:DNA mismatch repair protein MutS|nr:DNA mismatch repair protein MutS [Deltaproteobacteria bacterium]